MIEASSSHGEAILFASTNGADICAPTTSTKKQTNAPTANAQRRRLPRSHNFTSSANVLVGSNFTLRSSYPGSRMGRPVDCQRYWLCYHHNNQISVVIEPDASHLSK